MTVSFCLNSGHNRGSQEVEHFSSFLSSSSSVGRTPRLGRGGRVFKAHLLDHGDALTSPIRKIFMFILSASETVKDKDGTISSSRSSVQIAAIIRLGCGGSWFIPSRGDQWESRPHALYGNRFSIRKTEPFYKGLWRNWLALAAHNRSVQSSNLCGPIHMA